MRVNRSHPDLLSRGQAAVVLAFLAAAIACLLPGCVSTNGTGGSSGLPAGPTVQAVNFSDPIRAVPNDQPVLLAAAKNESVGFAIQITALPKPTGKKPIYSLRLHPPQVPGTDAPISADHYAVAQILPMPIDVNRAGFVRHTGLPVIQSRLPRALLPIPADNGLVNLNTLRDPADPTNPAARAGGPDAEPPLLWVDLHVPPQAQPGEYVASCELLESGKPVHALALKLTVYDFVLPDERHLVMVSRLQWDDLRRLYPKEFEVIQPRLLNRTLDEYASAVNVLDRIVAIAQRHRTTVVVPRLQPTVKWPAGQPPQVDWTDLDAVLKPWLSGEMFPDKTPPGYWPLPAPDYLERFDRSSQLQYWAEAASHFDQQGWLRQTSVMIDPANDGRVGLSAALQYSAEAAQVLNAHPRLRVTVPMEADQVRFADEAQPLMIDPRSVGRLMVAAPGLVFLPPMQAWPEKADKPQKWLRTDLPGLLPYIGAGGDERDVRLWSWLAFLRQVMRLENKQADPPPFIIQWSGTLPRQTGPKEPADPNEVVWFYPGSWFGVDEPVPTIQLKWLRRAQQDYEYLWLARQRGEALNSLIMARLITKPVELPVNQSSADPAYALMTGTADPQAWDDAQRLLARTILLRAPGAALDEAQRADLAARRTQLNLATLRWMKPHERPLLMSREADWLWDALHGGNWVALRLGLDIYNASDDTPSENLLGWTAIPDPSGWQMAPQPQTVPALSTYQVRRQTLEAFFDLDRVNNRDATEPLEVTFTHGHTRVKYPLKFVLPVAASERRVKPLDINGSLDDWNAADQIQAGPMVVMHNRPAVLRQELQRATTPSDLYTGWSEAGFYLAFKLTGLGPQDNTATRNFVSYQFRRAWGEDLCEVLVQPVYVNNTLGPVLHLVCKPNGQLWVKRQEPGKDAAAAGDWQALEGADIRFASTLESADWRGELAIPWKAILDPKRGTPTLLRFNFAQHRHATGESASWAGPIDFGRDDQFMGLLHLRIPKSPGMGAPVPR